MHIKFLARGTGSSRDAADYLLGERDATGQPREGVEVLRGDPNQVAAVADALAFEHRYTSGVIAWAPEDQPTDEQIEAVLTPSRRRPGRNWSPTDTPGPPCCTASAAAALTSTFSPRAATWTPAGASTSRPRVAEDVRPAPRRLQPRTRLEPAGRSDAGQGAAPRPPCLHRGGAAQDRSRAGGRTPRPDPGLPAPARRARHGAEPGRCRRRVAGSGPRSAAPGQGLPHRAGPRDRGPVAAERRAVWRRLRARTI